jgi:hypothetical protein
VSRPQGRLFLILGSAAVFRRRQKIAEDLPGGNAKRPRVANNRADPWIGSFDSWAVPGLGSIDRVERFVYSNPPKPIALMFSLELALL